MCSEFHPFKVNSLMSFNKYIYLCNHLPGQDTISTISITPKSSQKFPCTPLQPVRSHLPPAPAKIEP